MNPSPAPSDPHEAAALDAWQKMAEAAGQREAARLDALPPVELIALWRTAWTAWHNENEKDMNRVESAMRQANRIAKQLTHRHYALHGTKWEPATPLKDDGVIAARISTKPAPAKLPEWVESCDE